VWVVDVQKDDGFRTSKTRLLCKTTGFQVSGKVRSWDINLDGQKFLIVKLDERRLQPTTEMILVQNWLEELKRLVPVKKPEKGLAKGYEKTVPIWQRLHKSM
jgi:hypothetical protein